MSKNEVVRYKDDFKDEFRHRWNRADVLGWNAVLNLIRESV